MEFWAYYRILRRRYRLVAVTTLVGLILGFALSWPRQPEYLAMVTMTTSPPDETRYVLVLATDLVQARPDATKALAIELIRSRTVAERVIQRLNLNTSPIELRSRLRVTRGEGDLIVLTLRDNEPGTAVLLANTYAEVAVAYNQEVNRREAGLAREFIERELEATRVRLSAAEEALDTFKGRQGIVTLSTQIGAEVGRYIDLLAQQRGTLLVGREINARIAALRARLRDVAPTKTDQQVVENPVAARLRGDLVTLEVQKATALTTLTDKHPAVVALNQRITALRETLEREVKKVVSMEFIQVNPVYESTVRALIDLETQRIALQAKQLALASVLPAEQRKLPELNSVEREFTRLTRELQVIEAAYTNLQSRLNDFRIREQAAMNRNLVYIVDLASGALPAAPSRVVIQTVLAAVLGLSAGLGFVLFQHHIDDTLRTAKEAERVLGLPALSSIPHHNPPVEEAYRLLKTNMGLHAAHGDPKAIMFTGARAGSGTSTVVYHLAQAIARGGKSVIVVDTDLRHPTAHRLFGVGSEPGLPDVLQGLVEPAAALQISRVPRVRVLPATAPVGELADLFASVTMARLLEELKRLADVVLIDAPPVMPFAEVRALAAVVDGVVFVVGAGKVSREVQQEALRQLERMHARVLGVVVNMVALDEDDSRQLEEAYPGGNGTAPRVRGKGHTQPTGGVMLLAGVMGATSGLLISHAAVRPDSWQWVGQVARSAGVFTSQIAGRF